MILGFRVQTVKVLEVLVWNLVLEFRVRGLGWYCRLSMNTVQNPE